MKKIFVVVLAAGKSSRFGAEKILQVLPNGKTILGHILEVIRRADFSPVFLVTRQLETLPAEILHGPAVTAIVNPRAELGISTSIQTGIQQIPEGYDACLVVLGDQPYITRDLLRLLAAEYEQSGALIVHPLVNGARSNPVILDKSVFAAVMQLQGDMGARALLDRYQVSTVAWPDARLPLDVDTPQDFQRVIELWDDDPTQQG